MYIVLAIIAALIYFGWKDSKERRAKKISTLEGVSNFTASEFYLDGDSAFLIALDKQRQLLCYIDKENKVFLIPRNKLIETNLFEDSRTRTRASKIKTIRDNSFTSIWNGTSGKTVGAIATETISEEEARNVGVRLLVSDLNISSIDIVFLGGSSYVLKSSGKYQEAMGLATRWYNYFRILIKS